MTAMSDTFSDVNIAHDGMFINVPNVLVAIHYPAPCGPHSYECTL